MAQGKKRSPGRPSASGSKNEIISPESGIRSDIIAVVILAVGVFLFLTTQLNITGMFGNAIHDWMRGLFGIASFVVPYIFIVISILMFMGRVRKRAVKVTLISISLFLCLCMLDSVRFIDAANPMISMKYFGRHYADGVAGNGSGVFGMELGGILGKFIGKSGLVIFALTIMVICILLIINTPLSKFLDRFRMKRAERTICDENMPESKENKPVKRGIFSRLSSRDDDVIDLSDAGKESEILPHGHIDPIKDSENKKRIVGYVESDAISRGRDISDKTDESIKISGAEKDRKFACDRDEGQENKKTKSYGLDGKIHKSGTYGLEPQDLRDISAEGIAISGASEAESSPDSKVAAGLTCAGRGKRYKNDNKTSQADTDQIEEEIKNAATIEKQRINYKFPPISILRRPKSERNGMTAKQLREKAEKLEMTLKTFGVDAKVVQVTQGSSVTRYEVKPALGVKVSSIVKLQDDIALNMRATSLRIEAPIPGKAVVGIEIENEKPSPVVIRELIESEEFRDANSKITFVVGKDVAGNNVVANLKDMPHLLVAGATGSGKSVFINSIIASLLYKARPDEVKLILVDPKVVELSNYNGMPHMLIPVVTDPKKAAAALNWAVNEMDKRYDRFAKVRVRDLASYNRYVMNHNSEEPHLPQIVIIIDEFADLMMTASSQVEAAVARLAQKARAAGMHIIIATQRPSVDVITGLIKANIPSRVALMVSSAVDSRTILDGSGAEHLIGNGDMLFRPGDSNEAIRVQSPYISDDEISSLIDYVKNQGDADYNEDVIQRIDTHDGGKTGEAEDELTEDAIEFILKKKSASVSMLQRRFRIGYNRAARIIDEIENMGIIGPQDGSRGRQVLITEEEYNGESESEDEYCRE